MDPLLNIAIKAARRGGKLMLRYVDRADRVRVLQMGRNDLISELDQMVEREIIAVLQSRYPSHRMIAESQGGELLTDPAAEEVEWLIDPLSGGANYLHGHPHFALAVAARQYGQLQHAVIFDPLRDEMFTASRGRGAQCNNRRMRVTNQRHLARGLFALGAPSVRQHTAQAADNFAALRARIGDSRRGGAVALDLAYVACGRLDGCCAINMDAFDIAAGALLVRESGGLAADVNGRQNFLETGAIVAANKYVFNALLGALGECELS